MSQHDAAFSGTCVALPTEVAERMRGLSWHAELPGGFVPPAMEDLRLLSLTHWTFEGTTREGQLVVARRVAAMLLEIFEELFAARFPISQMCLVDDFGGDDEASMAGNNTSAFNCRLVAGTTRPSKHALGVAVDINPVQNPYVRGGRVYPPAATEYVDRSQRRPGMLFDGEPAVLAFTRRGWIWGGHWSEPKDYHHFELPDVLDS